MPRNDAVLAALHENDQIALVYEGQNPNGSAGDIAGLCDATGRVFGLMPHPERHVSPFQHPAWTRRGPISDHAEGPGLKIFRNAVEHAGERVGAGV